MSNEIKYDLPFEEYKDIDAVNASSFSYIDPDRDGCPAIWNQRFNYPVELDETAALSFGKAFHKYVLEFESFDASYVALTEAKKGELFDKALAAGSKAKGFSRALASYKEWVKELQEQGQEIIDEDTLVTLQRMRESVCDSMLSDLARAGDRETEVSLIGNLSDHRGNNVLCKGRLDLLKLPHIIDLKTVASASPVALGRFIAKFKLYVQAAFYVDLLESQGHEGVEFSWIFVDKRAPYPVVTYRLTESMLKLGRNEYRAFLGWIHDGREKNHWPGHSNMIEFSNWFQTLLDEI